ncbi:MATE family efflux transporter [Bradyrhizobium oligotrophicum]|uniref:MATE family efflux transporter n=1 Tax=Bradyrhizobium oligotrophicum TaxID=44255 RepID=UPI003EBCDD2D
MFVVPMMLSNILQSLFGTINNVYLGQMIGVDALAAVSVFFPAMFFFVSFVMGLGSGAGVLIGQAWGAGEPAKVKQIAGTTLSIALLLGGLIAVLGGVFSRELLTALATPANILDAAAGYARIMMITMPLTFAYILLSLQMRGVGDTVTPLASLAASTTLGLVLTPVFIRGWLGAPVLGVASAAWASAISTLTTLAWLHLHLRRRKHPLAIDAAFLRGMLPDAKLLRAVLRLGIPAAIGMIVMSLAEMVLIGLVAIGYLFSRVLMGFFITDPAVIEVAQHSLHIVLWSSVLFGISITFSSAMRASGTVWMPLAISAFAIAAIEVPAATWLSRSIGLDGVWLAYPITFAAMMLLQMSYYLVVWRKRTVHRMI